LLQVVDIGSGRGYLGCHLSLMYHIPVVGIDSSPSNTDSAAERTRLLRMHWRGLVSLSNILVIILHIIWSAVFICSGRYIWTLIYHNLLKSTVAVSSSTFSPKWCIPSTNPDRVSGELSCSWSLARLSSLHTNCVTSTLYLSK